MKIECHQIFSDESGYCGKDRYGTIAVVSGAKSETKSINTELQDILDQYKKEELKFSRYNGKSDLKRAIKDFLDTGIHYCRYKKIKIHVIIWDKQDSRHQVIGRDDNENLKYMYYKILKLAKSDWKNVYNWEFFPDEHTAVDWQNDVIKYIERTNLDKKRIADENMMFESMINIRFPDIQKCNELESNKYPILQLTDLFAGAIRLSYEKGDKYKIWLSNKATQGTLFEEQIPCDISKTEKYKFELLTDLKNICSKYTMGLNFSKEGHFKVFNKKSGLFIWFYRPQGEYDKAPTKNSKIN